MKKLSLIAAAALISGSSLFASTSDIIDLENGKVSGSLSAQHRYMDVDNNNNLLTGTANLKYVSSDKAFIQAGLNFYGITGFGAYDDQDRMDKFLNPDGSGFSILNEAYLKVNRDCKGADVTLQAGRFHMNEGLINSQENSMYNYPVPNAFEGAQASVKYNGFEAKFAWINRMSGEDNGLDRSKFETIESIVQSQNPGIDDTSSGLYYGKLAYSYKEIATISLENVYVDNFTNTFKEEIAVNAKVKDFKVFGGQQYLRYDSEDDSLNTNVYGVKVGVEPIKGLTTTLAYNYVADSAIPSFQFGADPLYTSMNVANAYGDTKLDAVKFGAKYKINSKTKVGMAIGSFKGDVVDTTAYEACGYYSVTKDINVKAMIGYADTISPDDGVETRLTVSYNF